MQKGISRCEHSPGSPVTAQAALVTCSVQVCLQKASEVEGSQAEPSESKRSQGKPYEAIACLLCTAACFKTLGI